MSRSVRINDEDYNIVKYLAQAEKRSFTKQLSIMIEQAAPKVPSGLIQKTKRRLGVK